MKLILSVLSFIILILLSASCEESFSPKGDFREKFILYSIINVDSSFQTAVLQRSYSIDGFDPYVNEDDPLISGADIRLRQGDYVFFMHDTTIERSDTSRYNTLFKLYYTNEFFVSGNDSLEIIATLPDGKKLYGITALPERVEFNNSVSDHIIPPEDKDRFTIAWYNEDSRTWFLPKFVFYYTKNGIRYEKEVPTEYVTENGKWRPVYPEITGSDMINFRISALDSAFRQISEGDPDKTAYEIFGGVLTLLVFNDHLSNYYSTSNGFLDDYTVRIDEADYTNIEGGLGIFGSFLKQRTGVLFTEEYIRSFGYTPGLD